MTTRKSRPAFVVGFLLLIAAAVLFFSFAQPVWAEKDDKPLTPKKAELQLKSDSPKEESGQGVHKDINTFKKNFGLTVAQKQYTITECEKVISKIITPEMSDLEKYYRIAVWVNDRVQYDWQFWSGGYNFDYYSHQWDAYGAMKEDEKSVCVGIAIFYSNMCHAADLPCRFVRLNPDYLDHTIDYIPDINGHAYYSDVTENVFLMSDKSGSSFTENADKVFAKIEKDADDNTFDFTEDGMLVPPALKDGGGYATYEEWFNEFALHKDTDKDFKTDYIEEGSGLRRTEAGSKHASYTAFPSNFTDSPKYWFLDDFYEDPAGIEQKILSKQFDEQLLNVSGVKKNYDCDSTEDLEAAVKEDISVEYFPSADAEGNIVPESAKLINGEDYEVEFVKYDDATHMAEFAINGKGFYQGSQALQVPMNSAYVAKAPVLVKDLVYDGTDQELVEPGKARIGDMPARMQYGIGTEKEPPEAFTSSIPTAENAGKYYVWYRAAGDKTHAPSQPQRVERPITIEPMEISIVVDDPTIEIGKTAKLSPELDLAELSATYTYESDDPSVATVSKAGVVKGLKEGMCGIDVHATLKKPNNNYTVYSSTVFVVIVKATNPLSVKGKTVSLKAKNLKKKNQTLAAVKVIKFTKKAKDKKNYKLASAKKGSKSFKKYFKINKTTGQVTVRKGLKKGTYKVKVKVKALGNKNYKASAVKTITIKVKIK